MRLGLCALLLAGCARARAPEPPPRRAWSPGGEAPFIAGIAYGPYREGQRPGGPDPDQEQLLEDLRVLSARWSAIRMYSARGPAETVLRLIHEHDLPLQVMLGAWIAPDAEDEDAEELEAVVRLARAWPEEVSIVCVGNETQVFWSGHRVAPERLIAALREVRARVAQPVTTADDYNFWNKPESAEVAREVDLLVLHAYAMWNGRSLHDALPWTAETVDAIRAAHPELPLVLGETGWATALNPEGGEVQHVKAPAGEAEQARFYAEFRAWAEAEALPHFWFEAFDEPWKGGDDPRDIEKHWGLYDVNRAPKAALRGEP